eukprot:6179905-Pleurochrysis_carterae.AAC.4
MDNNKLRPGSAPVWLTPRSSPKEAAKRIAPRESIMNHRPVGADGLRCTASAIGERSYRPSVPGVAETGGKPAPQRIPCRAFAVARMSLNRSQFCSCAGLSFCSAETSANLHSTGDGGAAAHACSCNKKDIEADTSCRARGDGARTSCARCSPASRSAWARTAEARSVASLRSCAHCASEKPRDFGSGAAAPSAIESRCASGRIAARALSSVVVVPRSSPCSQRISCCQRETQLLSCCEDDGCASLANTHTAGH